MTDDAILDDIVPVTHIAGLYGKSRQKSFPSFESSFATYGDDLIICEDSLPFFLSLEVVEIVVQEVHIGLSFDHDDPIDEEYLRDIFEFQYLQKTRFVLVEMVFWCGDSCLSMIFMTTEDMIDIMFIDHARCMGCDDELHLLFRLHLFQEGDEEFL